MVDVIHSYKRGDAVEFPESGTPRLGKFIKSTTIGSDEYAEVKHNDHTYIVNMGYLKPHGKEMDTDNPNRAFRIERLKGQKSDAGKTWNRRGEKWVPLFKKPSPDAVINRIKEIRTATGAGLKDAKYALEEAEYDTQIAIERIMQKRANQGREDDVCDYLDGFAEFLNDIED